MHFRYAIELAYNGANFSGWQIQPNALSVQAEIEQKIRHLSSTVTNIDFATMDNIEVVHD